VSLAGHPLPGLDCHAIPVSGLACDGIHAICRVRREPHEASVRSRFDHIPRDTPRDALSPPRRALHFSPRCRVFRVTLSSNLARFELLFVPYSAFFTRFLVLRATRGVCFADFSQLLISLPPFFPSLSLSHTHTHTHTHMGITGCPARKT